MSAALSPVPPSPVLLGLQSEATRLSLRPTFAALEPGLWAHGDREGKRRACHLYREGSPFVAASGFGTTDAEALGEALGRYRQRVALCERELAETRRTEGLFACPGCFPDHPADRGCEGCRGGLVATACCAYCDAEIEAPEAACQCGDPEFVLCRACETPGRHLAACPTAAGDRRCGHTIDEAERAADSRDFEREPCMDADLAEPRS